MRFQQPIIKWVKREPTTRGVITMNVPSIERKSNILFRGGITFLGASLISCGIAWMRFSRMGTDPFVTMNIGISEFIGMDFGTIQMLANIAVLLVMLRFRPRLIHLGTVLGIFFVGYFSDFLLGMLQNLPDTLTMRMLGLLIGLIACCFGVAVYMTADMGIAPYDALGIILLEKLPLRLTYREIRIMTDLSCVAVGLILGAKIGIGTIITAFFTGPLINYFKKKVEPFLTFAQFQKTAS